ncbi:MAG: thiamine phosphate synthase [Phycisphaerales bacterium JB065]
MTNERPDRCVCPRCPNPVCRQWSLCVLITESLCARPWEEVARAVLEAGADCIQLREKELPGRDLLTRARQLRGLTNQHGASLVINDRPDIAALVEADGVHLGQTDLPIAEARRIVGDGVCIGASATTLAQATEALRAGADSLGLGPMFATTTKPNPGGRTDGSLAGPALLREVLAKHPDTPHLAIGGITAANIAELRDAGAKGIAVSGAVCSAKDPGAITEQLLRLLKV